MRLQERLDGLSSMTIALQTTRFDFDGNLCFPIAPILTVIGTEAQVINQI